MEKNVIIEGIREELSTYTARSAWSKGVVRYEKDLIADLYQGLYDGSITERDITPEGIEKILLNGAKDWKEYSWGGSSLIYDEHIARRLCTPSELRKTYDGAKRPNPNEDWLDVQARALYQAAHLIKDALRKVTAAATWAAA